MSELQKYRCCPVTEDCYLSSDVDAALAADAARIELLQRAVEWCLENGVTRVGNEVFECFTYDVRSGPCQVPAEFADIIKVKP